MKPGQSCECSYVWLSKCRSSCSSVLFDDWQISSHISALFWLRGGLQETKHTIRSEMFTEVGFSRGNKQTKSILDRDLKVIQYVRKENTIQFITHCAFFTTLTENKQSHPSKCKGDILVPHVPVLCVFHSVGKRSVSSFRQR